jgi:hypothetical protein
MNKCIIMSMTISTKEMHNEREKNYSIKTRMDEISERKIDNTYST